MGNMHEADVALFYFFSIVQTHRKFICHVKV